MWTWLADWFKALTDRWRTDPIVLPEPAVSIGTEGKDMHEGTWKSPNWPEVPPGSRTYQMRADLIYWSAAPTDIVVTLLILSGTSDIALMLNGETAIPVDDYKLGGIQNVRTWALRGVNSLGVRKVDYFVGANGQVDLPSGTYAISVK